MAKCRRKAEGYRVTAPICQYSYSVMSKVGSALSRLAMHIAIQIQMQSRFEDQVKAIESHGFVASLRK